MLAVFQYTQHNLLFRDLVLLQSNPVMRYTVRYGPWFWVHMGYSYLLVFLSLVLALLQYRQLPRLYRPPSLVMIAALVFTIGGNILMTARLIPSSIDLSVTGSTLMILLVNRSINRNKGMDSLNRAKNELFNELEEATWILDDKNRVIERNVAAEYMQYFHNIAIAETDFNAITTQLSELAVDCRLYEDEGRGTDFIFLKHGAVNIYNLRRHDIKNKKGSIVGNVAICNDVTKNYLRAQRLERDFGVDALTGLMSQINFLQQCAVMDKPENLPICVIIGNVDGLNHVNEAMGADCGDTLIRKIANGLINTAPPNAAITRIRVDEYCVVLPRCTAQQAQALIAQFHLRIACTDLALPVSILFGASIKSSEEEGLNDVIHLAQTGVRQKKLRQPHKKACEGLR